MKYCKYCGNELLDEAVVCPKCGCQADAHTTFQNQQSYNQVIDKDTVIQKLSEYEKMSGIIWLVIGIVQIFTVVGIICGIWNIIVAYQRINYSKELPFKSSEIYSNFENQLTNIIVVLIINILFGAVIGVIGAIFDLFVRNYVIEHKDALA